MFIELGIELIERIVIGLGCSLSGGSFIIVQYSIQHIYLLLHTSNFVVVSVPSLV